MDSSEKIIAFADKTVFSIKGLEVKGLNTEQLEDILTKKLGTLVRVIGVTSSRIEMDVYGIAPEQIKRDENDVIKAVACAEGITLTDLAQIESNERIVEVDLNSIGEADAPYCARERWRRQ
ncbi:MAG TPA: hypothetical protein IAD42_08905 [Candidatus Scatomorpha pullistercoris]|uniref:Uncharacterized protein n=1 Tax=Candidatus Scatomorpha pullistercoris TaxID=2840929 RepID=A0A9D1K9K1_9FIRM|nr:hypothetical protein [Candidatus Scatomorpha pullistercoris]